MVVLLDNIIVCYYSSINGPFATHHATRQATFALIPRYIRHEVPPREALITLTDPSLIQ